MIKWVCYMHKGSFPFLLTTTLVLKKALDQIEIDSKFIHTLVSRKQDFRNHFLNSNVLRIYLRKSTFFENCYILFKKRRANLWSIFGNFTNQQNKRADELNTRSVSICRQGLYFSSLWFRFRSQEVMIVTTEIPIFQYL